MFKDPALKKFQADINLIDGQFVSSPASSLNFLKD
jgi:hypothetical protein